MKLLAKRRVPPLKFLPPFNNPQGINCQCEQCTLAEFGYVMYVLNWQPDRLLSYSMEQSMLKEMVRMKMWNHHNLFLSRLTTFAGLPIILPPSAIIRITGI